jgi:hypothetical protein
VGASGGWRWNTNRLTLAMFGLSVQYPNMLKVFALWLKFLMWPLVIGVFTAAAELINAQPGGWRSWANSLELKLALAFTGYSVGSTAPYLTDDGLLRRKFGKVEEGIVVVDEEKFELVKTAIVAYFFVGVAALLAAMVHDKLVSLFSGSVSKYIWGFCAFYWVMSGLLHVYVRSGPPRPPEKTRDVAPRSV